MRGGAELFAGVVADWRGTPEELPGCISVPVGRGIDFGLGRAAVCSAAAAAAAEAGSGACAEVSR